MVLKKGTLVYVKGKPKTRNWTGRIKGWVYRTPDHYSHLRPVKNGRLDSYCIAFFDGKIAFIMAENVRRL